MSVSGLSTRTMRHGRSMILRYSSGWKFATETRKRRFDNSLKSSVLTGSSFARVFLAEKGTLFDVFSESYSEGNTTGREKRRGAFSVYDTCDFQIV